MNEYIKSLYNKKRTYKKVCPFCNAVCENIAGGNLFCKCNAKYYWDDKVWLNRKTGERVKEREGEIDG